MIYNSLRVIARRNDEAIQKSQVATYGRPPLNNNE